MAIKTISIGNLEDVYQYDDTETYSDASAVQGIKAATIQVTTAPAEADDVLRLDDLGSLFAPHDAQYVVLVANSSLTVERVLTAGSGITITDAGAGSTVTVATSSGAFNEFWQSPVVDKDLTAPPI